MAIIDKKGFIHGKAGGYVYRQLGGVTVMQAAPAKVRQTEATKARAQEFGLASSAGKVLRRIFSGPSHHADSRVGHRLGQAVLKAIRNGEEEEQGFRDLHHGDLSQLEGFQFNQQSPVETVLNKTPEVEQGAGGTVNISIPAIDRSDLIFPEYSQSCTMRIMVVAVDFRKEYYQYLGCRDISIKNGQAMEAEEWAVEEQAEAGSIVMVSLSLHYFSSDGVSDTGISLNDTSFSPAAIIAALHVGEYGAAEREAEIEPYKHPMAGYLGNDILRELQRMQAKLEKRRQKQQKKENGTGSGGLPRVVKGKIAFEK